MHQLGISLMTAGLVLALTGCNQDAKETPAATPSAPTPAPSTPPTDTKAPVAAAPATGLPAQTVDNEADCSVYPVADIERVWGPGVQPPAPGGSNKVRQINGPANYQWTCKYDYDSGMGLTVSLQFRVWPTEDDAKRDFANSKQGEEMMAKRAPDSVSVGDESFVAGPAAKDVNRQIYVRKGRVCVLFSATNLSGVKPDYTDKLVQTFKLRWP
jgi:hypothetical protein